MALQKIFGHQMDVKPAGADFTGTNVLWSAVALNSSGALVRPSAGADIYGVIQSKGPQGGAIGTNITVVLAGSGAITKIICGGTVATGARVAVNASGQATTATTGQVSIGVARNGGSSGDFAEVVLTGPETV